MNKLYKQYLSTKELYISGMNNSMKCSDEPGSSSAINFLIGVYEETKITFFIIPSFEDWLSFNVKKKILDYVKKNPDSISNHELLELLELLEK